MPAPRGFRTPAWRRVPDPGVDVGAGRGVSGPPAADASGHCAHRRRPRPAKADYTINDPGPGSQLALLTVDMLKSATRRGGIAVRVK